MQSHVSITSIPSKTKFWFFSKPWSMIKTSRKIKTIIFHNCKTVYCKNKVCVIAAKIALIWGLSRYYICNKRIGQLLIISMLHPGSQIALLISKVLPKVWGKARLDPESRSDDCKFYMSVMRSSCSSWSASRWLKQ